MKTDIRPLLDRYFEGNTSAEEEKILRRYFTQNDLPEDLQIYTSLFRFLDDESAALNVLNEIQRETTGSKRLKSFFWGKRSKAFFLGRIRNIAAAAAVLVIVILLLTHPDKRSSPTNENYVWVDGKQITDPATIHKYAESSFDKVQSGGEIIEDQLRFMLE